MSTNESAGGYRLKSDLARICLPAPQAQEQRNLAWANSICLLFLLIGILGFRSTPPPAIPVKPLEEPQIVLLETPPPPPPSAQETKREEQTQEKPEAPPPSIVAVHNSPAIRFAVPTLGNWPAPAAISVAPSVNGVATAEVSRSAPEQPTLLQNTGRGGDRPQPDYPRMAQELGQQGAVVLLLTADDAGVIASVEVEQSSGSSILDHAAADFVKRHWTVSPGPRTRRFRAKILYQLN